jgi:hypothetical protein
MSNRYSRAPTSFPPLAGSGRRNRTVLRSVPSGTLLDPPHHSAGAPVPTRASLSTPGVMPVNEGPAPVPAGGHACSEGPAPVTTGSTPVPIPCLSVSEVAPKQTPLFQPHVRL